MNATHTVPQYKSFAQFLTLLRMIHGALCVSLAFLVAVFWYAMGTLPEPDPEKAAAINEQALLIAACVMSVGCIGVAAFLPRFAASKVTKDDLALKMRSVLFAKILFAAAFEGGGLLWGILGLLLRNPNYFIGSIAALAILIAAFPTASGVESALEGDAAAIDRKLKAGSKP
jgi:cytochrome bd-type quinol oxidase subunit 2